jgi:hypothetical protein
LPIPVFRNLFLGCKKTFLPGFLRIFFPVFSGGIFHRNVVLERSQKFQFLDATTGIFCRNSCGTVIPVFSPDSSGFLFPPKAVWRRPATKEGSLLSTIWTKIDLINLPHEQYYLTMVSTAPILCWCLLA